MEHPENLLWIIGAAVLLFAISFLEKKGGVVFKPCIAECFWSDLYVFSKLGDRDSGIYGSSGESMQLRL